MDVYAQQTENGVVAYILNGEEKLYPSFTVQNAAKDEQRIFLCEEDREKCFEYMPKTVEETEQSAGDAATEDVADVIAQATETSEEVLAQNAVEEEVEEVLNQNESEVK